MHFPYARAKTIYQDEQDHVYITEMLTARRQSIHPDVGFPGLRTLMLVGRDGPTLVSASSTRPQSNPLRPQRCDRTPPQPRHDCPPWLHCNHVALAFSTACGRSLDGHPTRPLCHHRSRVAPTSPSVRCHPALIAPRSGSTTFLPPRRSPLCPGVRCAAPTLPSVRSRLAPRAPVSSTPVHSTCRRASIRPSSEEMMC
jgi:hypothetical protein